MAHKITYIEGIYPTCSDCGVTWDENLDPQDFDCDEFNDCFDTVHPSKHSWMQARPWHWIECTTCPAHRPVSLVNPYLVGE
jgi:hypothetical protein